ncbi:RNA pseudouridine synthase [Stakelama sp. CBK3Z-3]|uniref:RNA pseudouridine synthase n=1 Tax=Stakelama flava TaxID=2860338 RepID=A0ABS6XNY5_9SPHN|nr:RNA pseudouridine synthase [Stakelama flava]MBW4331468.1 RNA pseudouridine synthase [Stakelama flava]
MIEDSVLFIDGEAVVIDKPAGLAVDRPRDGSPSVEAMLGDLTFGFQRPPKLVHRIDRDTSGCLLLSRNPKAHKRFHQAFEQGQVTKRYFALLDGAPQEDSGTIDLALTKVSSAATGWRMRGDAKGKAARTRWKVIERQPHRALVAFYPETGRTHQIRVHAAEGLGIPIMGDPVYGAGGGAMMLHAVSLSLPRPGKPDISAQAPWPERFTQVGFDRG